MPHAEKRAYGNRKGRDVLAVSVYVLSFPLGWIKHWGGGGGMTGSWRVWRGVFVRCWVPMM